MEKEEKKHIEEEEVKEEKKFDEIEMNEEEKLIEEIDKEYITKQKESQAIAQKQIYQIQKKYFKKHKTEIEKIIKGLPNYFRFPSPAGVSTYQRNNYNVDWEKLTFEVDSTRVQVSEPIKGNEDRFNYKLNVEKSTFFLIVPVNIDAVKLTLEAQLGISDLVVVTKKEFDKAIQVPF